MNKQAWQHGDTVQRRTVSAGSEPRKPWEHGDEVRIGYMRLVVDRRIPTPGDGKPDKWLVHSLDGTRDYEFQPYSGLRLVADRRPSRASVAAPRAAPSTVKVDRRNPTAGIGTTSRPSSKREPVITRVSADKGMGRETATNTALARLDRLESLMERLARSMVATVEARRKAGGKGGK